MSRRLDTKLVTKFFEDNTDKYIGLPSEVDILKDFLLFFLKEEGYVVVERGWDGSLRRWSDNDYA